MKPRPSLDARRITTVMLGVILVAGVALRLRGLAWPAAYTFDEEPFADNARRYLLGLADTNDHPPLGKLFMAVGILLFGYDPLGWRFAALVFGLESILVAFWLARAAFASARAGWLAAAFVAGDGFFLAYARAGLLDGILTCLVLWSMLAAVTARTWRGAFATALLVGLSMSVKWSGALALVPAAAALLWVGRVPRRGLLWLALAPLMHALIWMGALRLTGQPSDPGALWTLMTGLYHHHQKLGLTRNAAASPWYTWPWLVHPTLVKHALYGRDVRYASSMGNPALFLATSLAVLASPIRVGIARLRGHALGWPDAITRRAGLLLALGWLALLAPWMVGRGAYTFYYHYLPSYGFGLVLLAGSVAALERRRPRLTAGFVALALGMGAYFAPVWADLPLREEAAQRRLLFAPWRP